MWNAECGMKAQIMTAFDHGAGGWLQPHATNGSAVGTNAGISLELRTHWAFCIGHFTLH